MRVALVLSVPLVVLACSRESSTPPDAEPVEEGLLDPQFTDILETAARDYQDWGRVDEFPRVAPLPCADPSGRSDSSSQARLSAADDAPHGRKLYFLFAGHGKQSARHQYLGVGNSWSEPIPVGFAIVKQSWTAVSDSGPVPRAAVATLPDVPDPITWVEHEGGRLHVGEQAELFVMAKVGAADMPGTDGGWIYGTLTPNGRRVTSAGRVQSCMDCHDAAPHDRLFGLKE